MINQFINQKNTKTMATQIQQISEIRHLEIFKDLIEVLSDLYRDIYLNPTDPTDLIGQLRRKGWVSELEKYPMLNEAFSIIFKTYALGTDSYLSFAEKLVKNFGYL